MTSTWSLAVLRVITGGVFFAGGLLKVLALGTPAFERTLMWDMSGESAAVVIALSVVESGLGIMLCVGVWKKWSAAGILALLVVLSAVLFLYVDSAPDVVHQACGCFGRLDSEDAASPVFGVPLLRNGVLAVALLFSVRWREGARHPELRRGTAESG